MIIEHTAKDGTKSFKVRVGRRPAKTFSEKEWGSRKQARAEALKHEGELLAGGAISRRTTCDRYADRLMLHLRKEKLKRTGRPRKKSTLDTFQTSCNGFKEKWGHRFVTAIERSEARDWALDASAGPVKFAVMLFNRAVEEGLRPDNPFRGLAPPTVGRSNDAPPTVKEFERLVEACGVLGDYAPHFRAFLVFAGFTGLRPGELFALEWDDIDFDAMRIDVRRRLYSGELDLPKSNQTRRVVMTPPARDALLLLERVAATVFVSRRGRRLSQPTLSGYWAQVKAKADLDFDFYHATKHRFVHDAYVVRGLSRNAIAQQMGWSESSVEEMLKVYGHGDVGWEAEFDRAYGDNVVPLRKVAGE
jgi:integrase